MKNAKSLFNSVTLNNRFTKDSAASRYSTSSTGLETKIDEAKHNEIIQLIFDEASDKSLKAADLRKIMMAAGLGKDAWWKSYKAGLLEKENRGVYKISAAGLAEIGISSGKSTTDDLEINTKSKNAQQDLDRAVSKKARKYKVPKSARGEGFDDFFRSVLGNMNANIKKGTAEKLMLKGNPGSGKTSSVNQIATLFGMYLITIEGAHISEEQIINIPYVVTKGHNSTSHVASYVQTDIGYEVQDAQSALVSQIESLGFIKDTEHQKMLNQNKLMKNMYLKYKDFIDAVRRTPQHKSGFTNILFLDEYFRTGSVKIQNLLRTILNGQIGTSKIPDSSYLLFASNFDNSDGSLDDIPLNQQFTNLTFDIPSPDDFLSYIGDKYTPYNAETGEEDDPGRGSTQIQEDVYNTFVDMIDEDDMGSESNNVIISPRRMEQIMLYVNSKIPVQNEEQARSLMNYMKMQFTNYETGEVSDLYEKYNNAVKVLISNTSQGKVDTNNLTPLAITDWKTVLSESIDAKMDIGDDRTYPTVLSGMPGTSKTFTVKKLAEDKKMGIIIIDVSTLTADDVLGLPVPDEDGNVIKTNFTEPPLYKRIMKMYEEQTNLIQEGRKYNYILFLDELTRASSVQIFNKIRMLLLEKKVNQDFKIPDDIMIVSAMNPTDSGGGTMVLPDHTKDVLDILPVALGIDAVEKFMKGMYPEYKEEAEYLNFEVRDISFNVLQNMYQRFKSDTDNEGNPINNLLIQPYWWAAGDYNIMYVSPREMVDLFQGSISQIYTNFELDKWSEIQAPTEELLDEYIRLAKKYVYKKYEGMMDFVSDKHQLESPDANKFKKIIKMDIMNSEEFNIIKEVKSAAVKAQSISSIWAAGNYDLQTILDGEGDVIVENWLNSLDDYSEAATDFNILLKSILTKSWDVYWKFINEFTDFLEAINWENVQGGAFDGIYTIFIQSISKTAGVEDFQIWFSNKELVDESKNLLTKLKDMK